MRGIHQFTPTVHPSSPQSSHSINWKENILWKRGISVYHISSSIIASVLSLHQLEWTHLLKEEHISFPISSSIIASVLSLHQPHRKWSRVVDDVSPFRSAMQINDQVKSWDLSATRYILLRYRVPPQWKLDLHSGSYPVFHFERFRRRVVYVGMSRWYISSPLVRH